ncbi:MAG: hypothetical protein ACXVRP_03725, partial [Solirubrobacteraceae bacterium]
EAGAVYLSEYDRPQHDRRYAIDSARLRALGWRPSADLESAVERTVGWYQHHRDWWEALVVEAERVYAASGTAG